MEDLVVSMPEAVPPTDTPPDPKADGAVQDKRFTQAELDEQIKQRLDRESKKREAAADKAAKDAEAQAAKERGEWEKIAKGHETTIAELTTTVASMDALKAEVERVNAALSEQLKADRKNLPPYIIALLDKLQPVDQLLWIAENRSQLGHTNGNVHLPKTPDGDAAKKLITEEEKSRRLQESAVYLRKII